ncbi:hypothetical protein ACFQJD_04700 [Haloplanus sp. GCM10025708]
MRFGVDTDRDGVVDRWLDGFDGTDDGYRSLRVARERLGEGHLLGELSPDVTWDLVVEWTTGTVTSDLDVEFDFGFYATQTRHAMNSAAVTPDWSCPGRLCGTSTPPSSAGEISWIALSCPSEITPQDVTLDLSDDGGTVAVVGLSESITVETVLLKYGQRLDVFEGPVTEGQTFTTGEAAATYTQEKSAFPETNTTPPRSNSNPCPESYWIKYETDENRWFTGGDGSKNEGPSPNGTGQTDGGQT